MQGISKLRITTIVENSAWMRCLGQWGLSFLLEFVDAENVERKVVFDTGINDWAFNHNVKELEVDLSDVDAVVLSHGHLDHTAATVDVVKNSGGAGVYVHPHTSLKRLLENDEGKLTDIGVPKGQGVAEIREAGGEVFLNRGPIEVVPGVWITGEIERIPSFAPALPAVEGGRRIIIVDREEAEDEILDDLALWMDVEGLGAFVITGCAHSGLVNTLLQVQRVGEFKRIYGAIGGTHLVGCSEECLNQTIEGPRQFNLELISTCHCAGFKGTSRLRQAFPDAFILNYSSRIIETWKEPDERVS